MRKKMRAMNGDRLTFTGVFVRKGSKPAFRGPDLITILLQDIKTADGKIVADHLWFNYTKGFEAIEPLQEGDVIRFDARVQLYEKGYKGRRDDVYDRPVKADYKLSRPTRICKEGNDDQ
jgi:hypothetical protein